MKYINTKELSDEQYEDLSNLINDSLVVEDQFGLQVEYDVTDLKVDEDGKVYAPTEAFTYEENDNSDFVPTGGISEQRVELKNYQPVYDLIKR